MSEKPTNVSRLKDWLTIAAILGGGAWALWTFYFKEIFEPEHASQHLNINANLTSAGSRDGLLAVQVSVSITDRSARTVYIPQAVVLLEGAKVGRADPTAEAFAAEINEQFSRSKPLDFSRSLATIQVDSSVIGGGIILADWKLDPNETVSRDRVMYVNPASYDQIVLHVHVLEARSGDVAVRFWLYNNDVFPALFSKQGTPEVLIPGTNPYNTVRAETGFQYSFTTVGLSLWSLDKAAK